MISKQTKRSLSVEIVFRFTIMLITFSLIGGWYVFTTFSKAAETQKLASLAVLAQEKTSAIDVYLQSHLTRIKELGKNQQVRQSFPLLIEAFSHGADSSQYLAMAGSVDVFFREYQARWDYYDIFLIDMAGNIIYTVEHESDFGTNLNSGPYMHTALAKVFKNSHSFLQVNSSVFEFYEPSNEPAAFLSSPVINNDGMIIGVVALQFDSEAFNETIGDLVGLGTTGEVVVGQYFNNQVLITVPLRFDSGAAFNRTIDLDSELARPLILSSQGESGKGKMKDWRGVEVLAAWEYMPHLKSGIVIKMDVDESLALLHQTTYEMLFFAIFALALMILLTAYLSQRISLPLIKLRNHVQEYVTGDHNVRFSLQHQREDEVTEVASAFNEMANHIQDSEDKREALIIELEENNRQLDQRVNEQTENIRAIITHAIDGIITFDQQGIIQTINPAIKEIFDYTEDALLGKNVTVLMTKKHQQAHQKDLNSGDVKYHVAFDIDSLIDRITEVEGKRSDGEVFSMEISVRKLLVPNQVMFMGMIRDISKSKKMQSQMEHLQRLESLGVLAGGIAHDFNNILTAILGNAAMAERKALVNPQDAQMHLSKIVTSSEKAAELCKQMLAYSGKGKFVVQAIDLSIMVEEVSRLLDVSIAKGVVLKYHLPEKLPAVEADAAQLQQVIMNLVINASDAIGEKSGVISICTGIMHADTAYLKETCLDDSLSEGHYVFLEVSDTGCGMDRETQEKLFEPFFTTKLTGHGLGMSAVLGIVRGHHGAIKVYSEISRGTTFKVLLPASRAECIDIGINSKADTTGIFSGFSGTVLVVDDEETIRETAVMMLEDMGLDTLTAIDGADGVEVYRHNQDKIVAVLLDMTMPKLDGRGCFRELMRINPNVQVILSSGYNEQEATSLFTGKGLADFIQKPYSPDLLSEKIQKILISD